MSRLLHVSACLSLLLMTLPAAAQEAPLAPLRTPAEIRPQVPASQALVRSQDYGEALAALGEVRRIQAASLKATPTVNIGASKVDFRPILDNPRSLANVADQLRRMPALVEVREDVLEAVEVKQGGVVVRSTLGYRLKPGACSGNGRAQLASAGIACFERLGADPAAAFAQRGNPRYIADPKRRAEALARRAREQEQIRGQIDAGIAALRSGQGMAGGLRTRTDEAELARLRSLPDEQLAAELANQAEVRLEELAYVPATRASGSGSKQPAPGMQEASGAPRSFEVERFVFITGFTLAQDYQWKQRMETSINWCFVGCRETYYVELFAGFGYGVGLRFPIAFAGTYTYTPGSPGHGELKPVLEPVNASRQEYAAAGMPASKLFDGKELVAEVHANAGIGARLPGVGTHRFSIELDKDFTAALPKPFAGGQFTPPTPGGKDLSFVHTFDDFDLIGGYGNFGVVGGQVFPAVEIGMRGKQLGVVLEDLYDNNRRHAVVHGQAIPLRISPGSQAASFAVKEPVYGASFFIAPGLTARVFVDLAVWGAHWDWTVTFPELTIELPPGGVSFGCHEQTICERRYRYTPAGAQSQFESEQVGYAALFESSLAGKCADDSCRKAIAGLAQATLAKTKKMENAASVHDVTAVWQAARGKGEAIVEESRRNRDSERWAETLRGVWSGRCVDSTCVDEVGKLCAQTVGRARELRLQHPDSGDAVINGMLAQEFTPRLQAAVSAAEGRRRRVEAAKAGVERNPATAPQPAARPALRPVVKPGGQ